MLVRFAELPGKERARSRFEFRNMWVEPGRRTTFKDPSTKAVAMLEANGSPILRTDWANRGRVSLNGQEVRAPVAVVDEDHLAFRGKGREAMYEVQLDLAHAKVSRLAEERARGLSRPSAPPSKSYGCSDWSGVLLTVDDSGIKLDDREHGWDEIVDVTFSPHPPRVGNTGELLTSALRGVVAGLSVAEVAMLPMETATGEPAFNFESYRVFIRTHTKKGVSDEHLDFAAEECLSIARAIEHHSPFDVVRVVRLPGEK